MCGIAGSISLDYSEKNFQVIENIIADQLARGPDHQAAEIISVKNPSIVFGHNRLSIVDLSDQANQPMWDAARRYCIVFNGEIYNYVELRAELIQRGYVFQTSSDTEVILNAFAEWQMNCLNYFKGPFAFALYHKQNNEIYLCRDRFGVKPLYFYQTTDAIYFASTTHALAKKFQLTPNLAYAAQGLQYWIYEDGSDISPFNEIQSLLPAHYLKINCYSSEKINTQLVQYYDLTTQTELQHEQLALASQKDIFEKALAKLSQATQIRLRADVPVGISLSGGLDSSLIAALAAKNHHNLQAFCFGHPDAAMTEAPLAAKLAQQNPIEMHYVWPNGQQFAEAFLKTLQTQQAPFAGPSVIAQYLVFQAARQNGTKVLLGGQGGDEAFLGYRKFFYFYLKQLLAEKNYLAAVELFMQMLPMLWSEKKRWLQFWQNRHRYQNKKLTFLTLNLPLANKNLSLSSQKDLSARQIADIKEFSLPTLLRYEDRNSLGNSVESRLPMMDHEVIEFGLALPTHFKIHHGQGKWLLRKLLPDNVPAVITEARYKRGFDVTVKHFLAAGLGQSIRDRLYANEKNFKDYLLPDILIAKAFSDQQLSHPKIFAEAVTLLWLSNYL